MICKYSIVRSLIDYATLSRELRIIFYVSPRSTYTRISLLKDYYKYCILQENVKFIFIIELFSDNIVFIELFMYIITLYDYL